jgi:hypothetical protein
MSRLTELAAIRDGLRSRMSACTSDQNYAVMCRLLVDVLRQIDEMAPAKTKTKATGLSEFEKRLRDRQQGTKTPRRTKSG